MWSSDSRTIAAPQDSMSEDESTEEVDEKDAPEEEMVEPTLEEQLVAAILRAEKAEAEITYRDADIVNLRRRSATDRAELIKFSGFNLSGRILPVVDLSLIHI